MPVTTNCISNQFEVEIKINFTGLDFKPKDRPYHVPRRQAVIEVLGNVYGDLILRETNLTLIMYGVKRLQAQSMYLAVDPFYESTDVEDCATISRREGCAKISRKDFIGVQRAFLSFDLTLGRPYDKKKLKSVVGNIKISFEALKGRILKHTLINSISTINKIYSSPQSEKIKMICNNTTVSFDKKVLCSISDVFKTMFENPNNIESQNGAVCLEEVDPSTVEALQRFLCDSYIKEDDLNISMLLFADRYNIKPIFELCLNHLMKNVTRENFVEIAKVADMINARTLFKAVAEFICKNIGTFEDDPEIRKFMRSNPECFAKVLETMMFRK